MDTYKKDEFSPLSGTKPLWVPIDHIGCLFLRSSVEDLSYSLNDVNSRVDDSTNLKGRFKSIAPENQVHFSYSSLAGSMTYSKDDNRVHVRGELKSQLCLSCLAHFMTNDDERRKIKIHIMDFIKVKQKLWKRDIMSTGSEIEGVL